VAAEINADAAFTPDDQVRALACQRRGERFASRLAGRGIIDLAWLHERHPHRRTNRRCRSEQKPRRAKPGTRQRYRHCDDSTRDTPVQDRRGDRGVGRHEQDTRQPDPAE
jgi:hypothetical protein